MKAADIIINIGCYCSLRQRCQVLMIQS